MVSPTTSLKSVHFVHPFNKYLSYPCLRKTNSGLNFFFNTEHYPRLNDPKKLVTMNLSHCLVNTAGDLPNAAPPRTKWPELCTFIRFIPPATHKSVNCKQWSCPRSVVPPSLPYIVRCHLLPKQERFQVEAGLRHQKPGSKSPG